MLGHSHSDFDHFLGYEGRIWILWRHDLLDLEILEESGQFVHGRVREKHSQVEALITVIYASNLSEERILLWNNLKRLSRSIQSPWLVGGDFNEIYIVLETPYHGQIGRAIA
ncbi:hypothetical protein QJS10_CPB21g00970 [Acorus calamus]|uniref:Endonuclease/exonuclease/phosphatase domain-containing protein n=1 Tax=Acorus calamus TaxID=4465 RepID=A0AAV9C692_ACOCL|nr:hypothetical protein QJS10_CPB21g00970 [Acorus calamus]